MLRCLLVLSVLITLTHAHPAPTTTSTPFAKYSTLVVSGDFGFLERDGKDGGVFPGALGGLMGFGLSGATFGKVSTIGGGFPFLTCEGNTLGNECKFLLPLGEGDLSGLASKRSLLVGGFIGNTSTGVDTDGLGVWDAEKGKWSVIGTPGPSGRGNGASSMAVSGKRDQVAITGYFGDVNGVEVVTPAAVWSRKNGYSPLAVKGDGLSAGNVVDRISQLCALGVNKSLPMGVWTPSLAWKPRKEEDEDEEDVLVVGSNFREVPGLGSLESAGFVPFAASVKAKEGIPEKKWEGMLSSSGGGVRVADTKRSCQNFSGKNLTLTPVDNGSCEALFDSHAPIPSYGVCCSYVLPPFPNAETCLQPKGGGSLQATPLGNVWVVQGRASFEHLGNGPWLYKDDALVPLPPLPEGVINILASFVPVLNDVDNTVVGLLAFWSGSNGVNRFVLLDTEGYDGWSNVYTSPEGDVSIMSWRTVRCVDGYLVVSGIRDVDHQDGPQGTILMFSERICTSPPGQHQDGKDGAVKVGDWLDTPFSSMRKTTQLEYTSYGFVPQFVLSKSDLLDPSVPSYCNRPPPPTDFVIWSPEAMIEG